MTEKKEEWEIGYSRDNPAVPPPEKVNTADFAKSDLLVGKILDGRFLIEKDLTDTGADEGGIGLVYLAKDMKLMGKDVVVKILQKAALQNEDIARKFLHEKEALIRLDHPNIVRILDSGNLTDGNPFMVMEYIEGYSLRRKLRDEGRLSFETAANIIESVTNALSVAHSKGVLHRDIKPENIMLTPDEEGKERVRLIDFGIARVEDSKLAPATMTPRGIGTILYIAPEQLHGKLEQTPAVDIYSFAIVTYEMLTGELPFKPESVVEMFQLQQEGVKIPPRQLRPDLPEETEKLLLAALTFEASERPQNARQFGRDLANTLQQTLNNKQEVNPTNPNLGRTQPSAVKSDQNLLSVATIPSANSRRTPVTEDKKTNFPNIVAPVAEERNGSNKILWGVLLALLVVGAISGIAAFAYWKSSDNKPVAVIDNNSGNAGKGSVDGKTLTSDAPPTELSYYLTVQKMRGGKPFEEPFQSSGQEIFENGYKFKMNFQADADGFIYVFNEDQDAQGNLVYNILYPTPKTNNGSAAVKSKEPVETSINTFGGARGTEIVWLIWTAKKQADLEAARESAFSGQGTVKDTENVKKLKDFLEKYPSDKNETRKDSKNQQTIVKGKGDVFAQRIELEHR
jgi:serine/threonine protein kinase